MDPINFINKLFKEQKIVKAILSSPKTKDFKKITIRLLKIKDNFYYQISTQKGTQEFHENSAPDQLVKKLDSLISFFKQMHVYTDNELFHLLWNKKGEVTLVKNKSDLKTLESHNRKKNTLLCLEEPIPFLVALGIQNADGTLKSDKKDKFQQINRFIELTLQDLKTCQKIVDFGCGKAYLTFAMAYFLTNVRIEGVDLKTELLQELNLIAQRLEFKGLSFSQGKIEDYKSHEKPDAVISLHACNTATDEAIFKGIKWGAKLIIVAPCCHQELYKQIDSDNLKPILRHGILRERLAAIVTDAARAELLTINGYKTDVIEFIDHEHTPKNLLIRAVKTDRPVKFTNTYKQFCQSLNIHPHLESLLTSELDQK